MNFEKKFIKIKNLKIYNFKPRTYNDFLRVLENKSNNKDADLNDVDVSMLEKIEGFSKFDFFVENNFFVDEWDVSNVYFFEKCFENCFNFNSDISNWDTSNGLSFHNMFKNCKKFNQSVLNLNFENSKIVFNLFLNCESFNKEVYTFHFSNQNVSLMGLFENCFKFNEDVSMIDVKNVENFTKMFYGTKKFKQNLSNWDVSNAKYWGGIFRKSRMGKYPELIPLKFRY